MFKRQNARGSAAGILLVLALGLPAGAAQNPRDELDAVRDSLEEVIESLDGRNQLDKQALNELRRDLNRISRDLDQLRDSLEGRGSSPGQLPGADWQPFKQAEVEVWPSYAVFDGWNSKLKLRTETDNRAGEILLSIDNDSYTADWRIKAGFSGVPRVVVDTMATGDVYIGLEDKSGRREFLIKNGGIGPLYQRRSNSGAISGGKSTNPPIKSQGSLAWAQPYQDLVRAGQLSSSPGMEWLIGQVSSDSYEASALSGLGRYLSRDLPEQVRGEIAVLKYSQLLQTKRISIVDPRNSVSTFVYAMDKAYALHQLGTAFSIELK